MYLYQEYAGYCKIIGSYNNGAKKVICSNGKKAVEKSTKDWYPEPVEISESDIPTKILKKLNP